MRVCSLASKRQQKLNFPLCCWRLTVAKEVFTSFLGPRLEPHLSDGSHGFFESEKILYFW
jgi:hypothetical protein